MARHYRNLAPGEAGEPSWPLVRRIFRENASDYVWTYALAVLCLLVVSATTAYVAWIIRDVVDDIFVERRAEVILGISLSIMAAFTLRGIASYTQAVGLARVGNNLAARYQRRIVEKLTSLGMDFFSGAHSGALTAQIAQNVNGIRDVLNMTLTAVARDIMTMLGLLAVMIYQDPVLSLSILIVGPPLAFGVNWISRRIRSVTRQNILLNARLLGSIQETAQGMAVVKAYTMEDAVAGRIGAMIGESEKRANKIASVSERLNPIAETLAGFAVAAVVFYSGYRALHLSVPPGSTFAFITALLLAYDPARRLAKMQVGLQNALINARMVYDILDRDPGVTAREGTEILAGRSLGIRFDAVRFSYDGQTEVLSGTSFEAKAGKTTAIVGPSGSGKSTIAALILRFYDPQSGSISINGRDISGYTLQSLRTAIAYVSQHPYLFEGSIRDNIRYGRPDATDAEVEAAAQLANAHEFIIEQPQGYDTPAGENGVLLSGGQRQRISIARAILRDAPILLLDEATSALDNESEKKVQQALDTAMKGRTTIVIAHRLSTIINADRIITLVDGIIAEEGTHASLVKKRGGIYARFHAMQTAPSAKETESHE